jgi:phospholipid-binding lipoprotein MlaA
MYWVIFFLAAMKTNLICGKEATFLAVPRQFEPPDGQAVVYYDTIPVNQDGKMDESLRIRTIHDPLEPINRVTFFFNDKIYRYGISPAGRVYEVLIPRAARERIHNVLDNLAFPKHFLSALFQGKFDKSFKEVNRFVINSTVGIGGMFDVAKTMGIETDAEDFGQTLAFHGMGHGFYLVIPILGPSSGRDVFGLLVDTATDGKTYIQFAGEDFLAARVLMNVDSAITTVGKYDELTDQQYDPYVIIRDLYYAYREAEALK